MCKPKETSLPLQTFIPMRHGDPGQSTTAPFQQQHHSLSHSNSAFTVLSPHYAIFDSQNPIVQLIVSSTFYIFIFAASPPTAFIFALADE